MHKVFTCIICPNSCEITAQICGGTASNIRGNLCTKGIEYVKSEIINPQRNFATSVPVYGGDHALCSVRLTQPIPKARLFDVLEEIKKLCLKAPVASGDILLKDILGLGADVIATRDINAE